MLFEVLFVQKRKGLKFLALTLIVCVFSALVYATLSFYWFSATIGSGGRIKTLGVGVYCDEKCGIPVSFIDWALTEPGSVKNVTVYIRNEASVPTTISLDTVNWDPPDAPDYITLGWDYSGQLLGLNETVEVTLMLSISSAVQNITDFNFDIVISQFG